MNHTIKTVKLSGLQSIIDFCMTLREKDYWAFRGQRNKNWDVELHNGNIDFKSEMESFYKFKDRCKEFPKPDYLHEENNWRWLFYAQHFGLKTHLLDWTSNPLVAVYFAVENINSKFNYEQKCGAIWAIKVKEEKFIRAENIDTEPEEMKDWCLIKPPLVTKRIIRQSGMFTYHPTNEKFTKNTADREFIKIEITMTGRRNPTEKIRRELGIMNIHHASLFPEPAGIAEFVNYELPELAPNTNYNRKGKHPS